MTSVETHRSTSLPQRAVDAITRRISRRGVSRRSFLTRSAVVGSALALDPAGLLLRPRTAYASVCGDDPEYADGWSAFCATINDGANTCPSYSYPAGWWKIDNSTFCSGRARYIVDCNRHPDRSCSCHAANGQCDHRRVCCNNFRYGQCNTHIAGTTEVVCRIVLCTPPWRWGDCSTTSRTSNTTRTHWSAALPSRTSPTPITVRWLEMGLTGSILGDMVGQEEPGYRGGSWARFDGGTMVELPRGVTRVTSSRHATVYAEHGGAAGRFGYPMDDTAGRDPRQVFFEYGRIYRHDGQMRIQWYPFRDVPLGHPFFDETFWMHDQGITTGCNPDGDLFCPAKTATRQALAVFLVRALGLEETSEDAAFDDVPDDHPFAEEINKVATAGITTGFEDGTFRPGQEVTRQALAVFLVRALGLEETSEDATFDDVPDDHPFAEEINRIATAGITTGYEDGTFRPGRDTARQAVAAFLHRALA